MKLQLFSLNVILLIVGFWTLAGTAVGLFGGILISSWIFGAILLGYGLFAWLICRRYSKMVPAVYSVLMLALLAYLAFATQASRSFLADFETIQPGMNREEVASIMGDYLTEKEMGWPKPERWENGQAKASYFRYDDDHGNVDMGIVYFDSRDQVTGVEFLRD